MGLPHTRTNKYKQEAARVDIVLVWVHNFPTSESNINDKSFARAPRPTGEGGYDFCQDLSMRETDWVGLGVRVRRWVKNHFPPFSSNSSVAGRGMLISAFSTGIIEFHHHLRSHIGQSTQRFHDGHCDVGYDLGQLPSVVLPIMAHIGQKSSLKPLYAEHWGRDRC